MIKEENAYRLSGDLKISVRRKTAEPRIKSTDENVEDSYGEADSNSQVVDKKSRLFVLDKVQLAVPHQIQGEKHYPHSHLATE